jgi:hypothetical protein
MFEPEIKNMPKNLVFLGFTKCHTFSPPANSVYEKCSVKPTNTPRISSKEMYGSYPDSSL